ncbi:MAG TPA: carboxypeptidase-like regulatory domain-containing protein [Terriglobales bacterium]|jgi:hypothetical protein
MRSVRFVAFFILYIGIWFSLPAWGQFTAAGTIVGSVTDQSNAVISTAEITLTDAATGAKRTAESNETGHYTFTDVTPGHYKVEVSKQGFATSQTTVEVTVGVTRNLNFVLQVGAQNTVVEVQSTGIELQTTNATVGNEITGIALDALPSLNRDVSTFVELQPGVSPDGSVAGTMVDQSSFQLDGGNNTNDMDGSMSVYTSTFAGDPTGGVANGSLFAAAGPTGVMPTPADSVEEFKVNTAGQTADFNSSSGAQVQLVTRRGTNTWHGSLYEYYLDNKWSANTWDNNFNGLPVADWHRSRFGFRVGGPLLPKMLGGKTYIFANYEGYRWPNSETVTKADPSPAMRLGLLTFGSTTYNLNNAPVTYNGVTYPANAGCPGQCDPLGLGINPIVQTMWNTYMPLPNTTSAGICGPRCDGVNVQGYAANLSIPQTSNFGVIRLDHDFGDKWHVMSSYRYFNLKVATDEQVDIGGFFPGDKLGVPASQSNDPQLPWYYVLGVTTNISSNFTNDFHYSFLRNWWQWGRAGDTPQAAGLGGALEPFGEDANETLAPYNVNTQQTRTRFWDGKDHYFRDDLSLLKGNHLFQFGGAYQHNFNWHARTDNGGGINYQPVYQLGTKSGPGISMSSFVPATVTSDDATDFGRDYAAILGIVSISQQVYTRSGSNLALNPPLTPAFDQSTIPYYNVYFSDTWHMKPSFTLTYGLGWTLEMPPVEKDGKQVELVDDSNQVISTEAFLHTREQAALQGQVYNPTVGFNLVGNTENGRKYPYDPFYGAFSPRIAAAWNPKPDSGIWRSIFGNGETVIRGGYGRIYGRLNGVDLVLVPLLGTGLLQPVQCSPLLTGGPTACAATLGGSTPNTAFRIGYNGTNVAPIPAAAPTLPQPLFPGINGVAAGAGEALDPHFRPNNVDTFNISIQRQLSRSATLEVGYIGRLIHNEYQPININSVPYMMTVGGQRFDKAYANVVLQYCGGVKGLAGGGCVANAANVQPQAFFETALAGTGYCNGFANCTQALVANEGANGTGNLTFANVWSLYSDLDAGILGDGSSLGHDAFNFPRSMMNTPLLGAAPCPNSSDPTPCGANGQLTSGVGVNTSIGYGNYNGAFASLKLGDWHGLTAQSNFTWSKALNTGATYQATSASTVIDPFNLRSGYGVSGADRKFVYNMFLVYQPPFYKGQHGVQGHLLGGWTFAPIFTAGTGVPMILGTINGGGQAFGEGDSQNFFSNGESENAIPMAPLHGGVHYTFNGQPAGGSFPNFFGDPSAAYNSIRQPILGLDEMDGGWGFVRGLGYWNMDFSVKKVVNITERLNLQVDVVISNIFNHVMFYDPGFGGIASNDYLDTSSGPPDFGTLPGQGNTPRTMEFGIRLNF